MTIHGYVVHTLRVGKRAMIHYHLITFQLCLHMHSLQLFRKSFRDNETRLLNCWPRLPVRPLRMRILARFDVNERTEKPRFSEL